MEADGVLTDFLATLAAASPAVSAPRAKTVPPPLPAQALAPPPSRNGEGGEDRRAKQARHTELLAVIGCEPDQPPSFSIPKGFGFGTEALRNRRLRAEAFGTGGGLLRPT